MYVRSRSIVYENHMLNLRYKCSEQCAQLSR